MKKIVSLLILVTLILLGCSKENENDAYEIEGLSITSYYGWDLLTIFVEDNYGGYELMQDYYYDYNSKIDFDHYWVEAYRVKITEDTKIIDETSGKELKFKFTNGFFEMMEDNIELYGLFYSMGRSVAVKVEEKFEKKILDNRKGYILNHHEFLPLYTAKEIRILPLTYQDFLYNFSYFNKYALIVVLDNYNNDENSFHEKYDKYWEELQFINNELYRNNPEWFISFTALEKDYFNKYPVPVEKDEYPFFLIFNEENELTVLDDWESVIDYFEDVFEVTFDQNLVDEENERE